MSTPVVSLSYNSVSGEFTLKVSNASKASYVLEYDWQSNNPEKPEEIVTNTDALTNSLEASGSAALQDTQLAGTKSNDDTFVHPVTNGKLSLSATLPDGRTFEYQSTFKLTANKSVKLIAEQSSIKNASQGAVLGTTDTATPAAEVTTTTTRPVSTTTQTRTQTTEDPSTLSLEIPVLPTLIASGVIGLALVGGAIAWYINKQKQQNLPQQP